MSATENADMVREMLGYLTDDVPPLAAYAALDALVAKAETAETLKADYDDVFGQLLRRHGDVHALEARVTELETALRETAAELREMAATIRNLP